MKLFAGLILVSMANVLLFSARPCTSARVASPRLVNFVRLMAATFNNSQEVSEEIQNKLAKVHVLLFVVYAPVKVPALSSSITFLVKESLNNQLHRLFIPAVSLDPDGLIRLKIYDIPNIGKYSFETPESEIIAGLKEGDLKAQRSECDPTYAEIEPNVFFGNFPDCLDYPNTKAQNYVVLLTCNFISGFTPSNAQESANPIAYKANVTSRYSLSPISDLLGDFSSVKDPCTCS